jgi:serine/threonine protein kinase
MRHSEFAATDLKTVGNYTLGKLIGKGSFGKVYLASHKLSNGSKVRNGPTMAGKEEG